MLCSWPSPLWLSTISSFRRLAHSELPRHKTGSHCSPSYRPRGLPIAVGKSPATKPYAPTQRRMKRFNLGFTDPFFPGLDRGNADFDIRHRFVMSAVWEVPMFKNTRGALGQVLGGWSFAPILEARTGTPFTVFDCFEAVNTCPRYAPIAGGSLPQSGNSDPPSVAPNTLIILCCRHAWITAAPCLRQPLASRFRITETA
jgi:hypothetical protein